MERFKFDGINSDTRKRLENTESSSPKSEPKRHFRNKIMEYRTYLLRTRGWESKLPLIATAEDFNF